MTRRLLIAAGLLMGTIALLGAAPQIAFAQGGDRWVLIGTHDINVTYDRDTIDLTKSRGKVKALRLVAQREPILLAKVAVVYADGSKHNEDRNINLLSGERTRPIDLGGKERFVDAVHMFYKPETNSKRKVRMEVWALQSRTGASARRGGTDVASNAPVAPGLASGPAAKEAPKASFGDVLFGTKSVGFGVDRDVIGVGAEIGKFSRVRLRVLDNDVHLVNMRVVYGNGTADDVAYNADIKQNSRTRWIDLAGDRFIDKIELVYRSRPNFKGLARIEVYGEYADGWLGRDGEGRKYNQGWVLLGAQNAALRVGFEKDTIIVGKNEGGFAKVRLSVLDRAITLRELRIVYGNGETDIVPVNSRVDAGATYGPIDLIGKVRVIREVQLTYRSRFLDASAKGKGAAVVQVWARH